MGIAPYERMILIMHRSIISLPDLLIKARRTLFVNPFDMLLTSICEMNPPRESGCERDMIGGRYDCSMKPICQLRDSRSADLETTAFRL